MSGNNRPEFKYGVVYVPKHQTQPVSQEYELKHCFKCVQMTNHIGEICQKCKPTQEGCNLNTDKNIGMLRQWLNEDRKCTPMVTNEEITHWLNL